MNMKFFSVGKYFAKLNLLLLFLTQSCNYVQKNPHFSHIENYPQAISIKTIELVKFELEAIESSYIGELFINNEKIGFIDQKFCWVFFFDKDGQFLTRHLGQGRGPSEIPTGIIDGHSCLNDGSYFFVGSANDCYIFDENFQIINSFIIDKTAEKKSKNFEQPWIYTLCYENLIMKNYDNYLYYNIFSEYEDLNFIDSPIDYFKNVFIISKLNLTTGKVEQILGNYPDIYVNDKSLKQLSLVNFDIDSKGNFYLSFELIL